MHLNHPDNKPNSIFNRAIRYIGFAFAGLAFVLIVVCVTSLGVTRKVQQQYDIEVLQALRQLELVNTLHHNEDRVHNLLLTHLQTADPIAKQALRNKIQQGQDENVAALRELQPLLTARQIQELLQPITQERTAYYNFADSLLHLSDLNRKEEGEAFETTYIEPAYQRHEQYLNSLSRQVQAATDRRVRLVISGINSAVDWHTLLLLLAMAAAFGAFFIILWVFKTMRHENASLSHEIRQREQLQQELLEQKLEYKKLFNRNPVPMWIFDKNTFRFMEVNEAAIAEYGYTEEEFLKLTLFDIRPEGERKALREKLKKTDGKANAANKSYLHQRKDGSVFQVEVRAHDLPMLRDAHLRLVVAVNVQERENALEQLRKNEQLLREVSSSVPGAVFQYQMEPDGSFHFPYISEGVLNLCGVTPEEVYADPLLLYKNLHPEDLVAVQQTTAETYQNLTPWEQELRVWQPEAQKYMWVRGHSLPSSKGTGTVTWNGTFIDITKQKEAQEQLVRKEAKLTALLDSSLQAIFLLDEDLNVISFNKEAADDVRRYLLKELKAGQSMLHFVTHAQVPVVKENHAKAMRGETVVYEAGYGDYWHEITYQPVKSPDLSILGVALNIRNISEQKKSFKTIQLNELQLARAQQLAKLGSWEYDVKQDALTWSKGTYVLYGLQPGKFMPSLRSMLTLVHPKDRERVRSMYSNAIENKRMLNVEHRIVRPDGVVTDVMEVAEVICDEHGELLKLHGTVQDITERKKAEQEITESKNLLQTTIENIPGIIFTANPDLTIIYISPQCELITGYPEEAFLGDSARWLKSIHSDDKKPLMLEVLPRVLEGQPQEYEMRLLDSNGRLRWLLLRMSPGMDSAGRVKRIYGSASDMTEYKEAEMRQHELSQQLLQQNQNLQQFAYIVSHNLRAPIANILGLTSIYNRNQIDAAINQQVIDNLVKSANLLDGTIRDLNDILTIRSQIGNVYETVAFDCLLQDVLALHHEEIAASGATVTADFSEALEVKTVRSYAHSILLNLLSNAFKYKSPHRKLGINIHTLRVNGYICLRIQDNGLGIDLEKQQEKIFGLYKRFHKGIEGKGIGLHLVKTQVEMLGGKVEVESEPQSGTTFRVYFKI